MRRPLCLGLLSLLSVVQAPVLRAQRVTPARMDSLLSHLVGKGDTIRLAFAYADGPFRDTFVYRRAANTWHLKLESRDAAGAWRLFAEYEVTPAR